ncbi:hypothetical protein [Baekduia sp.]|uniref:hypothetical protein n=1 Tax=Baekduia sp. TaxID=2600305 RepID=UPI002D79F8DF|nr:hypothetical protein [Baekduia sp.]
MMVPRLAALVATLLVALTWATASAHAYGIVDFGGDYTDPSGAPLLQAGAHADVTTDITTPFRVDGAGNAVPDGNMKEISVDLPAGVTGNPTALPVCALAQLRASACPPETQAGVVQLTGALFGGSGVPSPLGDPVAVYNVETTPGVPGRFGFNVFNVLTFIDARVRPGDAGISADIHGISRSLPLTGTRLTLWGVPADPSHDAQRYDPTTYMNGVRSNAPRRPLMTNATRCSAGVETTNLRTTSWQAPDTSSSASFTKDQNDTPIAFTGCGDLPFAASIAAAPTTTEAGAPTGLDVDVTVPQDQNPDGLATAHLRNAVVTLPEGMAVSPSAADGLAACAPAQIALASAAAPTCPDASKLGSVTIDTPLLDSPLQGSIYLAAQNDNPFGSLLAIYLVAQGSGVTIKIPGRIAPDATTGRLTASFTDTPQLPFTELSLHFDGGPRAVLSNAATCGAQTTTARFTAWNGKEVTSTSGFTLDRGAGGGACGPLGFAPAFTAGTLDNSAGGFSPLVVRFARGDADQRLGTIAVNLPAGLLGRISGVALCGDAAAAAGTCGAESRVGTATTEAGPGARPFALPGAVSLTGPYKGAPFGLSIVVPAIAGPLNLGTVVVRAAIHVDPHTTALRIVSDPLPTILQGIPLQLRSVQIAIDRPGFTFNPTSCAPSAIGAAIGSVEGASAVAASRFQAADCASLGYAPKLSLALTGAGQTRDGKHPGLVAHLAPRAADANSRRVKVALPLSLALDPDNAQGLCEPSDAAADRCPATSVVGHAKAVSILHEPLSGPVYFVRGERKDPKTGRTIKSLPTLYLPLRGEGVQIDLNASSSVVDDHLVTTFDGIPDAPLTSFDLSIDGGKHGILVVTGGADVCQATQVAGAALVGQNNKASSPTITVGTNCRLGVVGSSHTSRSLRVKLSGLGAGRVVVTGSGLKRTARTLSAATTATVTVPLSAAARRAVARGRNVKVTVRVAFTPKGSKVSKKVTKRLVVHGAK